MNPHEVLAGRVLRTTAEGTSLLLIKGRSVQVRSQIALTPGQTVALRVKQVAPSAVLQFLSASPGSTRSFSLPVLLNALKDNIWKSSQEMILKGDPVKTGLGDLLGLMKDTGKGLFRNPGPDLLNLLISKTGINLEAKLKKAVAANRRPKSEFHRQIQNDLKGLLLTAISRGNDRSGALQGLLSVIRNVQLLNRESMAREGKIYVIIPMEFTDGIISMGQLLLEPMQWDQNSRDYRSDAEAIRKATFLVELSRLGPLRAEIVLRSKTASISIFVVKRQTREIIHRYLETFTHALSSRGFSVNAFDCHIKDLQTVTQAILPEIIPEDSSSICLVA